MANIKDKNIKINSKLKPPSGSNFKLVDAVDVLIDFTNISTEKFFTASIDDVQLLTLFIGNYSLYYRNIALNTVLINRSGNIAASKITWKDLLYLNLYNMNVDGTSMFGDDVHIDGNLYVSNNIYLSSDIRLKLNIKNIRNGLGVINKLRPVTYNFKANPSQKLYGLIAQLLLRVLPDLVILTNGIKQVNYTKLIPFIIKAIQEISKSIR